MATQVQFERDYAAFGREARPFEMDDAVGFVIAEFSLHDGCPFYPIGAVLGAKISTVWLGEGAPPENDESNHAIIFKMREDYSFFEVVLRAKGGARWGGSLYGQALEVTDEIIGGQRVLIVTADDTKVRYEFNSRLGQYVSCICCDDVMPTMRIARSQLH
ncbi:MAG: hypothetical protein ACOZAM_05940 [Pseudomonadota bacterium]